MNFAPELSEIIAESKYLEKLGFAVPDLARSVALQEDKFLAYRDGLTHTLHRYHSLLAALPEAEVRGEGLHGGGRGYMEGGGAAWRGKGYMDGRCCMEGEGLYVGGGAALIGEGLF